MFLGVNQALCALQMQDFNVTDSTASIRANIGLKVRRHASGKQHNMDEPVQRMQGRASTLPWV
eukprot:564165-Rhodomonas_salina.2